MRTVVIFVGLYTIVSVTGCGGGSVEHEHFESPEFSDAGFLWPHVNRMRGLR